MSFTDLVDLASATVGGAVLLANDEFFAGKENLIAPSRPCKNYSQYRAAVRWLRACRSLLRCFGSIQCSIRSGTIRVSRN